MFYNIFFKIFCFYLVYYTDNQANKRLQKKSLLLKIFECKVSGGVEDDIGVDADPLSQKDDRGHVVLTVDPRDVDMAIDKGLHIGMLAIIVTREVQQVAGGTQV